MDKKTHTKMWPFSRSFRVYVIYQTKLIVTLNRWIKLDVGFMLAFSDAFDC